MKWFLILFLTACGSSPPKEYLCGDEKNLPKEIISCEGEACGFYHYNRALKNIELYEKPDLNSKKIGTIHQCEKLNEIEPIMIIKSYGRAQVVTPGEELKKFKIKKDSIVPIYQYQGEGYLALCVNDKHNIQADMTGIATGDKTIANIKILSSTLSDAWMRLTLKDGQKGYAPRSNETVMWYATIDEKKLCHPSHKKLLRNF